MRETELLIPAGSLDVLKTAVIYGADAVYIGGEAFGLRAKAKNFSKEDILRKLQDKLNISMQQASEYFEIYGKNTK